MGPGSEHRGYSERMPTLRTRMTPRDTAESHRVSSPLELLFDLTFVAAIAQVAAQLAHAAEEGHAVQALVPFAMVFFAIWWAWMNFTWFASAYDTDDVLYRVMTLVQMGGVLVLAAGVPAAFEGDFGAVTLGYLIMRIGLVAQWLRAAIAHPDGRSIALGYAIGITVVQVLWLLRLTLPVGQAGWAFAVLVVLELAVPPIAERGRGTAWHPHHIAERYGLFVIILLGEGVLAATIAAQGALAAGSRGELAIVGAAGLVTLFGLWWLYFSEPSASGLERRRGRSYLWGYGHYLVFAARAAIGAGLEVAVVYLNHHGELDAVAVGYGISIPVAIFLVFVWLSHAPLGVRAGLHPVATVLGCVAILVLPLTANVPATLAGIAVVVGILVAITYLPSRRTGR
jgi:low temperature requirement protein LtrA